MKESGVGKFLGESESGVRVGKARESESGVGVGNSVNRLPSPGFSFSVSLNIKETHLAGKIKINPMLCEQ